MVERLLGQGKGWSETVEKRCAVDIALKAFPRGKVAAGGLPQTDEGALDLDILVLQALSPKTQKSKAPLIRQSKSMLCHLPHKGGRL